MYYVVSYWYFDVKFNAWTLPHPLCIYKSWLVQTPAPQSGCHKWNNKSLQNKKICFHTNLLDLLCVWFSLFCSSELRLESSVEKYINHILFNFALKIFFWKLKGFKTYNQSFKKNPLQLQCQEYVSKVKNTLV